MSHLTPVFVVLIAAAAFVVYLVRPSEPSQANVVQAFGGYKTPGFEAGPVPGLRNISKEGCERVTAAEGFLCEVSYTVQHLPSNPPVRMTRVHRFFQVEGGAWGQQLWNANVKRDVAEFQQWRSGHAFGTLLGYTLASVLGALVLCMVLPAVPWAAPGMNARATPWAGRAIRSGSGSADNIADGFTNAANTLTPSAVLVLISLGLAVAGFMAGGLWVPEYAIDLRYMGWAERLCLLASGISWGSVGFCLPMLLMRLLALGVVVFVFYAVLVLPVAWVFTGQSPAQVLTRNSDTVDKFFTSAKPSTPPASKSAKGSAPSAREGFEGYRQLLNW